MHFKVLKKIIAAKIYKPLSKQLQPEQNSTSIYHLKCNWNTTILISDEIGGLIFSSIHYQKVGRLGKNQDTIK